MSAGNTTAYATVVAARHERLQVVSAAEISSAPPVETSPFYNWSPIDPAVNLTEPQASTGVLAKGSDPDSRVKQLHVHLQDILPAKLESLVFAADVRGLALDWPIHYADGSSTQLAGKSDAACCLVTAPRSNPLEMAVCLWDFKSPGQSKSDWSGKFKRQAVFQMLGYEKRYGRPIVVIVSDLKDNLIVIGTKYAGGDKKNGFRYFMSDILEFSGPQRMQLRLDEHWGWLCHFLGLEAAKVLEFFENSRVYLPVRTIKEDEDDDDDDFNGQEDEEEDRDGGSGGKKGEAGSSKLPNVAAIDLGSTGGAGKGREGAPQQHQQSRFAGDENVAPADLDRATLTNIKNALKVHRFQTWADQTPYGRRRNG